MVDSNLKDKQLARVLPAVTGHLVAGEEAVLLLNGTSLRPMVDTLVVTTARVLALHTSDLNRLKFEARAGQVTAEGDGRKIICRGSDGAELKFGMSKDDVARATEAVQALSYGPAADDAVASTLEAADDLREDTEAAWAAVTVVGDSARVNKPTWKALRAAARDGEVPYFLIAGPNGAGALAAFSDRCMIVKAGLATGFMAGSFGGSRQATFHYTEITGIEYNSGLMSGVLEVLTPSYSGSANKDYWRGTNRSRNNDSNDPWTLSNTLPLMKSGHRHAQTQINELRRLVGASKQVSLSVQAAAPAAAERTLASELAKLGELRQQGLLDDAEFAEAKRAVLARFGD